MLDAAMHDFGHHSVRGVRQNDDVEAEPAAPVRSDCSSDRLLVDEPEQLVPLVGRSGFAPPPLQVGGLPDAGSRMAGANAVKQIDRRSEIVPPTQESFRLAHDREPTDRTAPAGRQTRTAPGASLEKGRSRGPLRSLDRHRIERSRIWSVPAPARSMRELTSTRWPLAPADRAFRSSVDPATILAILMDMSAAEHLSLADVKNRLSEVVETLEREHGRVVVTKHGRPAVVMLSVEDLESLEETLDVGRDPALRTAIRRGFLDMRAGRMQQLTREDLLDRISNR